MPQLLNVKIVSSASLGKIPLADKAGSFQPSGEKRDWKGGRTAGDGGYTATHHPAKLEINLNLVPGLDVDAINGLADEDVTVTLSDGRIFMMLQATRTGETANIDDGNAKVTIHADSSERI